MPVYFIRAGEDGPVKIGVAQDVRVRLADLQVAHHEELHVINAVGGDSSAERRAHRIYAHKRLRGEWFEFCPSMERLTQDDLRGRIETFADVIDAWPSLQSLADDIGARYGTVQVWKHRSSIPGGKWLDIEAAAQRRGYDHITLRLLATLAKNKAEPVE